MQLRYVVKLLGVLVILQSLAMVVPIVWELLFIIPKTGSTSVLWAFGQSTVIGVVCGCLLAITCWQHGAKLQRREAMLLVSTAWLLCALVASLPFWFWAQSHSFQAGEDRTFVTFINCYFEAMSGLTTTGATVLADIESLPDSLLLWRSFTHWLGGLGIIVLFVIILPMVSGRGGMKKLIGTEASGISLQEATPSIKDVTRGLLGIYSSLTIALMISLKVADPTLSALSIVSHSFSTLGTGGFSVFNASAAPLSPTCLWITILFMTAAGINFGLYQALVSGRWRLILRNAELRFYLTLMVGATVVIFLSLWMDGMSPALALRDAAFQASSIQTSTGFASTDYGTWPLLAQGALVVLMLVGGCAGSTAGGLKAIRVLAMLKILYVELERSYRPKVMRTTRVGGRDLSDERRASITTYLIGMTLLCGIAALLLSLTEHGTSMDGVTVLSATVAAVNNIGPGFGLVGPVEHFGWFSTPGKFILCLLMVAGRLEFFALAVIFTPRFWRQN